MNSRHRKTLEAIFANPVNGNLKWVEVEALFVAIGCQVIEVPDLRSVSKKMVTEPASIDRTHRKPPWCTG